MRAVGIELGECFASKQEHIDCERNGHDIAQRHERFRRDFIGRKTAKHGERENQKRWSRREGRREKARCDDGRVPEGATAKAL